MRAFSSNIRTLLTIGSGFSYSFTAALILIFTLVLHLTPRPPLSLGRYSTAVELRRCLPPFSLINFLVSLSMFCSSPNGQCWVQVGYVKTGKANWFVAVYTVKSWKEPISANTNKLKSSNSLRHRASPKHLEANSATGSAAMRIIFSTQLQEELYQASM